MSYSFVSDTPDSQFYKIKLVLYKDTGSFTRFEDSIFLGVHKNDVLRSKVTAIKAYVLSKNVVSGTIPGNNCGMLSNFHVEQVVYEAIVGVPYLADSGYIITWPRCCRVTGEANVNDNFGMMSAAFISPGKFKNSSPGVAVNPFMFLCPGKVSEISYQVEDKDGDSLVYSMVQPYAGGSSVNPLPYADVMNVPDYLPAFYPVTYYNGFSVAKPFGAGGLSEIDPSSGKSYLRSQQTGKYSLAMEVKEYRQGVLLGAVRYDFIVTIPLVACNNSAPMINLTTGDSVNLTFVAGKNKCYQMIISDTKDSVFLTSKGDILDGTGGYTGTKATLPNASGFKSTQSQLCWVPPISSVSSTPYLVKALVKDNGCPAALRYLKYYIRVVDSGLTSAAGPELLNDKKLTLFPNPVSDRLMIRFTEQNNTETTFQVFNLFGERVFEAKGVAGEVEFELNLSSLSSGIYFLQSERGDELFYSKFIRQ